MIAANPFLPRAVRKEVRALLPAWSACTIAVIAGGAADDARVFWGGVLAYVVGSVALGAQSMGHEYSQRTLSVLLSQPAERRALLLAKLTVLAVMLAALAALADGVLFTMAGFELPSADRLKPLLLFPALCGLLVAPWMTMLGRSGLAGVVFTIAIPGAILVLTEAIGASAYGGASSQVDDFRLAVWPKAMLVFCAVGAVLGWRTFMHLEAVDGSGEDIRLTRRRAVSPSRGGSRMWRLAKKEFHLQQLTLVLVGLYLAWWIAAGAVKHFVPDFEDFALVPATMLYLVLLSMLAGSLASAEERQLGTLEWQMLLPMAAWQQWLVKAGTVLALAFACGIGLPALLFYFEASGSGFRDPSGVWRPTVIMIVLFTTGSLYVSSLSTSGIRALVAAFPAVFATAVLVSSSMSFVWRTFSRLMLDPFGAEVSVRIQRTLPAAAYDAIFGALVGGFAFLLLLLAFRNHRTADRRLAQVLRQIACIAAFLVAGVMVWAGVLVWSYSG